MRPYGAEHLWREDARDGHRGKARQDAKLAINESIENNLNKWELEDLRCTCSCCMQECDCEACQILAARKST